MYGFETMFIGLFGLIYIGIVVAAFVGFVMMIQALRRMADAQEQTVRTLNVIASRMAQGSEPG